MSTIKKSDSKWKEVARKKEETYGFSIDVREPMSFYLGCVQMVLRENEEFIGVADPRRDGSAKGALS